MRLGEKGLHVGKETACGKEADKWEAFKHQTAKHIMREPVKESLISGPRWSGYGLYLRVMKR